MTDVCVGRSKPQVFTTLNHSSNGKDPNPTGPDYPMRDEMQLRYSPISFRGYFVRQPALLCTVFAAISLTEMMGQQAEKPAAAAETAAPSSWPLAV